MPGEHDRASEQLNDKLGITVVEEGPDRVVATLPVDGNRQPAGLLHGGANAVLAESIGTYCATLASGGLPVVGLELNCTHHRGVKDGVVTGVATPAHVGRHTITVDIVISDALGRRTCTARLTCVILRSSRKD